MKIKNGLLLKEVAGNFVVVPVGNISFNAMLTLNETGYLLWKKLEEGAEKEDLVNLLLSEYDITNEIAESDVTAFIEKLEKAGILE